MNSKKFRRIFARRSAKFILLMRSAKFILLMRSAKFILLFVGLIVVTIGFLLGNGVMIGPQDNQNNINLELGVWTSDTIIEQTFIASMDNLCRIDFHFDSYHPWDNPYIECRLFEIDSNEKPPDLPYDFIKTHSKEVRYKRLNGWLLSYHMFNSFSFPPISHSKDKRYLLSIQFPGLTQGGTTILLASPTDRYLYYGNLFENGERKEGDLAFRLLYKKPRVALIQKSFEKLALQKPVFFSKPAAYYVLCIGYVVLLMLLLYRIAVL